MRRECLPGPVAPIWDVLWYGILKKRAGIVPAMDPDLRKEGKFWTILQGKHYNIKKHLTNAAERGRLFVIDKTID